MDGRSSELLPRGQTPWSRAGGGRCSVAEVYADFIAHVMSLKDFLPEDHMDAWKTYFSQIQTWPQLDNYLEKTPDWYLPEKWKKRCRLGSFGPVICRVLADKQVRAAWRSAAMGRRSLRRFSSVSLPVKSRSASGE